MIGRGQNVDRAAKFEQHVAGADDARAKRGRDVVRRAADDRRSGSQPAFRRALIRDDAEDFVRGDLARQRAARDMRKRDQRVVDRVRREVNESSLERPVLLDRALAREAPVDVVVRAEHRADAREDLGLMPLDPSKLGRDELLIDSVAGLGEKGFLVDLGAKLLDFRAAARIALLDAGPEQAPGLVEEDDRRQHAGHADRGDVGGRDAARAQKLAHDFADVAPPLLRVFLRPADMVRAKRDRPRGEGERLIRAGG